MKTILLCILIMLVLCLALIYGLIPAEIKVTDHAYAACIPKNIADCLRNDNAWKKWWPAETSDSGIFAFGNCNYKLTEPFTDGANIQLYKNDRSISTRILVIPAGRDSSIVEWRALLNRGFNPVRRVVQWFQAKQIKDNIHSLLDTLVFFASKTENIYGFPIERTTFKDTILAATKFSSSSYPTTQAIYKAVEQLKDKIKQDSAQEKDFPMLNVRQDDTHHFETMIAICVNKEINRTREFFPSRMVPMKDRFLKTEVTGGPGSIRNAHDAIEAYMRDRFLSAPAIPFEILITDRSREPDTAKWKTTIFHPSM
jgi:hypothetical protein